MKIQIISERSPRVGEKTFSLHGWGTSLQSTDCCSSLLSALHQWDTVGKKQRYAFLIHFLPGICKMCCFVGNLLGLFLIAVWDVRKHSDFKPRTVAEFTFQ